jgi:hypothetical protein
VIGGGRARSSKEAGAERQPLSERFQAPSRRVRRSLPEVITMGRSLGFSARAGYNRVELLFDTVSNRSKIQKSFWTEFETVCELLGMIDRNLAFVFQDASRNGVINLEDFAQLAGRNLVLFN